MDTIALGEDFTRTVTIIDEITPDADLPDDAEIFISTSRGGDPIHSDLDLTASAVDDSPHTWRAIFPGDAITAHLGPLVGSAVFCRLRVGTHVNRAKEFRVVAAREC